MANAADNIIYGGFVFYNTFDSANLARVEQVKPCDVSEKDGCEAEGKSCEDSSDYEFNLWTKHDCHGTQFQNHNRTWFHFGIKSTVSGISVKFNIVNLNKQVKMFSQGMCPVYKMVPGHLHWERIKEKPTYTIDQKGSDFTLSFVYVTPENPKAITYFAFTYPFSYTDLQNYLRRIEVRIAKRTITSADDVYYHRECAIKSLEGRRLDVITISSFHNISTEREDRLNNMFPEKNEERPFKFWDKKVIFISARVHPGETPSSFVLNGFLNFLINRDDQIAINLRRLYVFKLIPMLNPDGVARGHYRMDTKGVNLNRVYLNPSEKDHPTIYAARTLIRYYHHSYKLPVELPDEVSTMNMENSENDISIINPSGTIASAVRDTTTRLLQQVTLMTLDEKRKSQPEIFQECTLMKTNLDDIVNGGGESLSDEKDEIDSTIDNKSNDKKTYTAVGVGPLPKGSEESGLFLYIDFHGHASKKGVFMYGNYFDDMEDTITCMLLPKLMSINNPNFHFTSCNFTERNMYIIDKRDGMSREGSGRVAVYKLTGLIRSYTLECNYNSGRLVNMVPARIRDATNKTAAHMFIPPKYTPAVFEAVGAALGPSILDLTNNNPNSRLPNSQYRSLRGVKSYLKLAYMNNLAAPSGKTLNKDDNGISSQDSYNSKGTDSETNESATAGKSSTKSETNLVKKSCIIRRSTSLCTAVKRIKGGKKPRQTISRRPLKNQCVNSIETSPKLAKPEVNGKSYLNSGEHRRYKPSGFGYTNEQFSTKKLAAVNKLVKTSLFPEETAIVKQGAKRLKIISNRTIKAQPETGESSAASSEIAKPSEKTLFFCNRQKGAVTRVRKHCPPVEQNKSSKLREMSKKVVPESFVRKEGTSKILN